MIAPALTVADPEVVLRHLVAGSRPEDRGHETPCWVWGGRPDDKGYGRTSIGGVRTRVHRWAYAAGVASIPEGLVVDHLCRVRMCCRPDHLEAVTQGVNVHRGVGVTPTNLTKTECPKGHPYDEANTYVDRKGWRYCRTCRAAASARFERTKRMTDWSRDGTAIGSLA